MKLFLLEHNSVFEDIKREFEIVDKIEDADKILLWNDVLPMERGIINLAHSLGKKVYVYQHGRKGTSKYYPPFNEKIYADKLLVWGEFDRTALLQTGQDSKKIKVVGSTIFTHLRERKKHKGINIIFCPEHWDRPVQENQDVRKELRKLKGVNIITKIIDVHDPKDFDNPIISNRNDFNHLDICVDVLTVADLVVSVAEGTFELLAQAMDIPVVVMTDWQPKAFGGDIRNTQARRIYSRGCKTTPLKDLIETIKQQLKKPQELRQQRLEVCWEEGGLGLNTMELIKKEIVN